MAVQFQQATKRKARLRMGLVGPSGSGKTYTALKVATALVPGGKIAVVDSERGSASKYAGLFKFDVVELETFSPEKYIECIEAASAQGYDVVIVDSLSHAWAGAGGALEMVDNAMARSKGNKFAAWRDVTPVHNRLVDTILRARCHVIATMRAKTEWVLEQNEHGKQVPRKVGLTPVQRDGMEYEFDVVGDLDDAKYTVSKTRCPALRGQLFREPGEEVAKVLRDWLTDGADELAPTPTPANVVPLAPIEGRRSAPAQVSAKRATDDMEGQVQQARARRLWNKAKDSGVTKEDFGRWYAAILNHAKPSAEWTREELDTLEACLGDLLQLKQPKPPPQQDEADVPF